MMFFIAPLQWLFSSLISSPVHHHEWAKQVPRSIKAKSVWPRITAPPFIQYIVEKKLNFSHQSEIQADFPLKCCFQSPFKIFEEAGVLVVCGSLLCSVLSVLGFAFLWPGKQVSPFLSPTTTPHSTPWSASSEIGTHIGTGATRVRQHTTTPTTSSPAPWWRPVPTFISWGWSTYDQLKDISIVCESPFIYWWALLICI